MESLVSAPIISQSVTPPSADLKHSAGETPKQVSSYGDVQPRLLFNNSCSNHTIAMLRERSKSIAVANPSSGVRERSKSFALKVSIP